MLNKTQKGKEEKIESEHKRRFLSLGFLFSYLVVILVGLALYSVRNDVYLTETLTTKNHAYKLLISTTPADLQKGLGGLTSLPQDRGMIFVFKSLGTQCFWMKNMKFPIDMIWVTDAKTVAYIQSNVSPQTYPETFCPNVAVKYVIELNAGQAKSGDIKVGNKLTF